MEHSTHNMEHEAYSMKQKRSYRELFRSMLRVPCSMFHGKKGFTLIETVLYLAMSSVILAVTMMMLYSLIQYRAKDSIKRDVDSEVLRILEYMSQSIRNSQTVEIRDGNDDPILSGFGEKISIDTLNINSTSTNMLVYEDTGKMIVEQNSVPSDLSSGLVNISNLQFRYLTGDNGGVAGTEIVDIRFVANYSLAGSGFYDYQRDIALSVKLR